MTTDHLETDVFDEQRTVLLPIDIRHGTPPPGFPAGKGVLGQS
jgi:hypothetical protein